MEPVVELVGRLPAARPGTDLHLRYRHMEGVDEVRVEELSDGGRPTTEPDILPARPPARSRTVAGAPLTK
jgi:hypothetical protein